MSIWSTVLNLVAKAVGAASSEALDKDDISALAQLFNTIPALGQLTERRATEGPFQAHILHITEAFVAAHRKYLPPITSANMDFLKATFVPEYVDKFPRDVEAIITEQLKQSVQLPGSFDRDDLEVINQWTGHPLNTPVYKALWSAFSRQSWLKLMEVEVGDDEPTFDLVQWRETTNKITPYLIDIDKDGDLGKGRRQFEYYFRIEYAKRVDALNLEQKALEERKRIIYQDALLSDMATWRDNHVFGNITKEQFEEGDDGIVSFMPLEEMYVEPTHGDDKSQILDDLLSVDAPSLNVVSGHFGMGKSLTSRMLASKLAQDYLDAETPSSNNTLPLYVICKDSFNSTLSPKDIFKDAVWRALYKLGIHTTDDDPELPLFNSKQRYHIILDGLDEVFLTHTNTSTLFRKLRKILGSQTTCTVFTRPMAIDKQTDEIDAIFNLNNFDDSQVEDWTIKWNFLAQKPIESQNLIRAFDDIGGVPILLFMYSVVGAPDGHTLTKTNIYETFLLMIARGKSKHGSERHDVIHQANQTLLEKLKNTNEKLCAGIIKHESEPMLWLFAQIAWKDHSLSLADTHQPLTDFEVRSILKNKLGIGNIECTHGAIFALQTSERDEDTILFKHKSFKEFLCAKRWEYGLRKLATENLDLNGLDEDLFDAPLSLQSEETFDHLTTLLEFPYWTQKRKEMLATQIDLCIKSLKMKPKRGDLKTIYDEVSWHIKRTLIQVCCFIKSGYQIPQKPFMNIMDTERCWARINNLVHLTRLKIPEAKLESAQLSLLDFNATNLQHVSFKNSDLSHSQFIESKCQNTDFSEAHLVRANFNSACLINADLTKSNSFSALFRKADLTNATLIEAKLHAAVFLHATLIGANLTGANLTNANLTNANLTNANFVGANLTGANLTGADLTNANFTKAKYTRDTYATQFPEGFEPDAHNMIDVTEKTNEPIPEIEKEVR